VSGVGIDIGSVATKAVVLRGGQVVGSALLPTGTTPRAAGSRALARALEEAGAQDAGEALVVATGYGRAEVDGAARAITEIQAAARGAGQLVPNADAVVDLGGQDTKAIRLGTGGIVADFAMNDKCAAGTGRFLEMMARVLGQGLDQMGRLSERSAGAARIESTCAVFAEAEVVSLIARGVSEPEIAAGLFAAIASRIAALVKRLGQTQRCVFIGGGARIPAMQKAIEAKLKTRLHVPDDPQLVVALGAALTAEDLQTD